jgi:hypothetical protein
MYCIVAIHETLVERQYYQGDERCGSGMLLSVAYIPFVLGGWF